MLDKRQMDTLTKNVGRNIRELIEAMDWTQAKLAEKMGTSAAAISNYRGGDRLPPLEFLVSLCAMQEFKNKGLELTLDLLISERFNPKALIQKRYNQPSVVRHEVKHGDFLGNYLCYFFDQSKPDHNQDHKLNRELRYGVVSVFDVYESLNGEVSIRAIAEFFKEDGAEKAFELKKTLDSIFKSGVNINSRNMAIEEAFKVEDASAYEGAVTFSDHHTFINVQSSIYGDNAFGLRI